MKEKRMRPLKLVLPAVLLMAGFVVCTTSSYGTPAYAKKEGKDGKILACQTCHEKAAKKGEPNLNPVGTCYQKNNHTDLAKCQK
jgi:cytochrome c553